MTRKNSRFEARSVLRELPPGQYGETLRFPYGAIHDLHSTTVATVLSRLARLVNRYQRIGGMIRYYYRDAA